VLGRTDVEEARQLIDILFGTGVNLFDTAEFILTVCRRRRQFAGQSTADCRVGTHCSTVRFLKMG